MVISVNSVLMAVAVGVLGTLLRSEHQGQRHCERTTTLMRLAEQFRDDVAAAREATVVAGQPSEMLRLRGPNDRAIEIMRDGDRVRRIEYQGSSVVRREAYTLIDLSDVGFVVEDTKIVTARLTFSDAARGIGESWRLDARLAKDWRYAEAEGKP